MTTYYNINPKFYVSVDCIIFGFDEGELKPVSYTHLTLPTIA